MKVRSISNRVAVTGVASALAAAGLVGAGTTAAHADPSTATAVYGCQIPGAPQALPIAVTGSGDIPITSGPSGWSIANSGLPVGVAFTVPQPVASAIHGAPYNVNNVTASSTDFALALGTSNIAISGIQSAATAITGEAVTLPTQGATGDITLPGVGNYFISLPTTFTLHLVTDSALIGTTDALCTIGDPSTAGIAPFRVDQQASTLTAKGPRTVKKGAVAKVTATVAGAYKAATGKVVAKEGKKILATAPIKNGKAILSIKKLSLGKHKITVSYKGDKDTAATSPVVVPVTVKR
jgi:hypothetical protein